MGTTPTAETLDHILGAYMRAYEQQGNITPLALFVLTDGKPDYQEALKQTLRKHARQLDERKAPFRQLFIQFFQVGNDETAKDFLTELDVGLGDDVRDMVAAMSCTKIAGDLRKALLGALSDLVAKSAQK